jgi:4-amino-4-deoxy-L-arabinose transferase-like glycosyltransferase
MTPPPLFSRRVHLLLLTLALLLGAVLRFTGLGEGIPFSLGVDEPEIVERSVRMMKTGEFHPHFFDYPGLYIYLQFLTACVRFVVGGMQGLWANLKDAPPSEFYVWGRAVTATFGTMTILLVYHAGRRISPLTGLLAAVLFAVQSMHVRESHFVLTDVPMTFFITLAWVLSLRAFEERTVRAFAWAGVAAGLAAATKYNGGVAILLPMLVLLIGAGDWQWRLRALGVVVLGAAVAFLAGAPYTVLALPEFLNAFAYLSHMYAVGQRLQEPAWVLYLKYLRNNFSIPGLLAAAAGVVLMVRDVWRAPRSIASVTWTTTTLFTLMYFWMIASQRLTYGRYVIPLLPFLCVLAGGALAWAIEALRVRVGRPRVAALAAAVLLFVVAWVPTTNALTTLSNTRKVATEEQTYHWILENIPRKTKVAMETRGILLDPNQYQVDYPARLIRYDFSYYQAQGFEYLIASSQSFGVALYHTPREAGAAEQYDELFRRLEPVMTFLPTADHPGAEWRVYRVPKP